VTQRIAFAGTRGVPANYGGFETAVDEITRRFVAAGYECDVFCRLSHSGEQLDQHEGRRLIYVKGATQTWLETFASAFQTGWYLLLHRRDYDHVFWFNNANFPGILLALLAGIPLTVNTDGLEWRRKKWSWPFKVYYMATSWFISRIVPRLVSDSFGIQEFYRKVFWRKTMMIPYGVPRRVEISPEEQAGILQSYNLQPGKYFLQITRFEPDNLPLEITKGFLESGLGERGYQYVAVGYRGDSPYALALHELSGRGGGVRVLPAVYDPKVLFTLRTNCFAYVHGNSVGGTNPALLEAMSTCPRILAIDVPFSREVMAGSGLYFRPDNIAAAIGQSLEQPAQCETFQKRAAWYDWDAVARAYMEIIEGLAPKYAGEAVELLD
jgi:glycosyltransferase involved in cell wall biosynthesis